MRRFGMILMFVFTFISYAYNQDIIVRTNGDTIFGEIEKVEDDKIYFQIAVEGKTINSYLDISDVSDYHINNIDKTFTKETPVENKMPPPDKKLVITDLIVLTTGDTIFCIIVRIENNKIYYQIKQENIIKSTSVSLDEVTHHAKDVEAYVDVDMSHKSEPDLPADHPPSDSSVSRDKQYFTNPHNLIDEPETKDKKVTKADLPKFTLMAGGGLGRLNGSSNDTTDAMNRYWFKLQHSWQLNGGATWWFAKAMGISINYSFFQASYNEKNVVHTGINRNVLHANMSDKIYCHYFGPGAQWRFPFGKSRLSMNASAGVGFLFYINKNWYNEDFYDIKGQTLAIEGSFGFDFRVTKNVTAGINIHSLMGYFRKFDINGTIYEYNEWLAGGRDDISIIVKWQL